MLGEEHGNFQMSKLLLFKSPALPYIDYGDTAYCTTSAYNLDRLQKLQNSACRSILEHKRDSSVASMHVDLDILPLDKCRQLHINMECHESYYKVHIVCLNSSRL